MKVSFQSTIAFILASWFIASISLLPLQSNAQYCNISSTAGMGPNLIKNGDFSSGGNDPSGPIGFTTDYTYLQSPGQVSQKNISVLTDAYNINCSWRELSHSGSGNLLACDGSWNPNDNIWTQTVKNIEKNTKYYFSFWLNNLVRTKFNYSDPQMQLFINGSAMQFGNGMNYAEVDETPNNWVQVCGTWCSKNNTTATLQFRLKSTASLGNDVGIDEIELRKVSSALVGTRIVYSTICEGDANAFNGQYSSYPPGQYTDSTRQPVACGYDSLIIQHITIVPVYTTTSQATICTGGKFLFDGKYYNKDGIYTITKSSYQGCDSILILDLRVNSPDTFYVDTTICQNEIFSFKGNYYLKTGNYVIYETNSNGCTDVWFLNLKHHPLSHTYINATTCEGKSYLLGGINYSTSGIYKHYETNQYGCDSIITLDLQVNPPEDTMLIDTSICEGEQLLLNGIYYNKTGQYPIIKKNIYNCDSIVILNLEVNPIDTFIMDTTICDGESILLDGLYYHLKGHYVISKQAYTGCDSTLILELNVVPQDLSTDTFFCYGESITLDAGNNGANYLWSNGSTEQQITIAKGGIYYVNTIMGGCNRTDTIKVVQYPVPKPYLGPDIIFCPVWGSIILDPGDWSSYIWSPGGETTRTLTIDTAGHYAVEVRNEYNCVSSDNIKISMYCEPYVQMPNTFTPNQDGLNDFFVPKCNYIKNYSLIIYNRWGEELFRSENKGWDGTFKNRLCPGGVYIYILFYSDLAGKTYMLTGNVSLIR